MDFKELKFINGICQLDYNYYVVSFTLLKDKKSYRQTEWGQARTT